MPIPNLRPTPHPAQPAVALDAVAVDGLALTGGAAIDSPARLVVSLRPYAVVKTAANAPAYLTAPADAVPPQEFVIPDVYAWVQDRAQAGDMVPMQALGLLTQAVAAEYTRRG